MLCRIGGAKSDIAPAFGFVRPGQHHEAMTLKRLFAIIAHRGRQEMELDIGPFQRCIRANEPAGFEMVADAQTALEEEPFGANQELWNRPILPFRVIGSLQSY